MKYRRLAMLMLFLVILVPARVHATVYMVWVLNQTITKVICFQGALDVRNQFDPSQYINLTNGFSTDVIKNLPPFTPVLLNGEQMQQLQKSLSEMKTTAGSPDT
ncbi:MAG: hypothetical protein HN417_12130 [Desulfobacula sp.]|jgi:hypothetical protein|nr:hypothetical protein [Desulfobacula sp.]MBT7259648.1 hypothetical protein [Desulfobacula sp.]